MTEAKAQTERALHWLPDEDQAEAQDAAAQESAQDSWSLAVNAGGNGMNKTDMLHRIQRRESTINITKAQIIVAVRHVVGEVLHRRLDEMFMFVGTRAWNP